jgi:hypothetical protein
MPPGSLPVPRYFSTALRRGNDHAVVASVQIGIECDIIDTCEVHRDSQHRAYVRQPVDEELTRQRG